MDPEARLARLLAEIQNEFPRFRLVPKDQSRLQRALARILSTLTLGRQRAYLEGYVTTIGQTVYVPPDWEHRSAADRYITLRHERVHLRQFRRFGLVPMAIAYLLLPLPMGLAAVRAHLERQAYAEGLTAMREVYGPDHARRPEVRAQVIAQFVGPAYGWMWPFRRAVERWYDRVIRETP